MYTNAEFIKSQEEQRKCLEVQARLDWSQLSEPLAQASKSIGLVVNPQPRRIEDIVWPEKLLLQDTTPQGSLTSFGQSNFGAILKDEILQQAKQEIGELC